MVDSVTLSTPTQSVTLTRTKDEIEGMLDRSSRGKTGDGSGQRIRIPSETEFFSQKFLEAPALKELGDALIAKWPEFGGFEDLTIRYVWQKKGSVKNGFNVLGKCQKVSGLAEYFGECDYVIAIAADHARAYDFTREQMTALVYHELCHIDLDEDEETGDPIKRVKGHDVEMFHAEIRRYGLWKSDLEAARNTFAQLGLDLTGDGE